MFKRILIPLDGSELAESALPPAGYLARVFESEITLIHVIEENPPSTVHGERHLITGTEAELYLESLRTTAGLPAASVVCHVHTAATGNVARSIVEHQGEFAPDLIVLCTHGRGGLKRILLGSIAQRVVAAGETPVLLIRPERKGRDATFAVETLLAPLDGEAAHEAGLEAACLMARATGARLQLLSVVPTFGSLSGRAATMGKFMPGATRELLELKKRDLLSYLEKQVQCRQADGVRVSAEIQVGDTAPVIAKAAERMDADIIVLGTHGKAGNEAFWTNSVGARVQALTRRPLLLIPVGP